jgi:hypothetical protein
MDESGQPEKPKKPRKPRTNRQKVTDDQIILAINKAGGVYAEIARICKVSRPSIMERIKNTPALQDAYKTAEDLTSDSAETGLIAAIRKKEPWAIKYWLSRKGKGRGYGTSVELTGETVGKVVMVMPEDFRDKKKYPNGRPADT